MADEPFDADWRQHRLLLLAQIKNLDERFEKIDRKIDEIRREELSEMRTDIALLKLKASLWGGLMGSIGGILVAMVTMFKAIK